MQASCQAASRVRGIYETVFISKTMIEFRINYIRNVNYAQCCNGIPVCDSIEIVNRSGHDLKDFHITCEGPFTTSFESSPISLFVAGETIKLKDIGMMPLPEKVVALTERVVSFFRVMAYSGDELVHEQRFELDLMTYDQWMGTSVMPQSLVSFVTPNHPSINEVIIKSASVLKDLTGSSSFKAYQTGSADNVSQQVAAVFTALHQMGIVYRALPAGFETIGQRVTLPQQVLATKLGNCIELTLLFASVLENIGLNTVIILQKQHAFLGVWLVDECCSQSVSDDAAYIAKKCSKGIDEMMVLETTSMTDENCSFSNAVSIAERNMAELDSFEMFIDVYRCRLEHVRPLPSLKEVDGVWRMSDGVEHDSCEVSLQEHDRFDLSRLNTNNRELTKLDIWERKLLDFTLRNSLLNLSMNRRAVQFMSFEVNRIEDHLQEGKEYCLMPRVEGNVKVECDDKIFHSKLYDSYRDLIKRDIDAQILHSYKTELETQNVLKNIYRATRTAIEETGANPLFLSVGLLRWYESPSSVVPRYAPLLLLPVEMVYKKGKYFIRTREEDITLNITLIEYLRQIHGIDVNGLNPLPKDHSGVDVDLIFAAIRDALKDQKNWDVEEECLLGTFSFSKFLMWNDVHNNRAELTQNPIVNSLIANRLTWAPEQIDLNLKSYDETTSPVEVNLPMPADSSQMAAVIAGGKGTSFILYGPPGTGKSQTITNLIANALYQGKRVLFVAEKMAALSVVQKRLEKIGLAPFCLELHSNKSTKRHVLGQLENALKVTHIMPPKDFLSVAEQILQERKRLIAYMNELHRTDPEDGLSLYECLVRYESIDAEPLEEYILTPALSAVVKSDGIKHAENLLGSEADTLLKLVGQPSLHPLRGLNLDKSKVTSPDAFTAQLKDGLQVIEVVSAQAAELHKTPGIAEKILMTNSPAILSEDARGLFDEWRKARSKWFLPRYFAKRSFMKKLRGFNPYVMECDVDELLSDLMKYRHHHDEIERLRVVLRDLLEMETQEDTMPAASVISEATEALNRWQKHTDKMRDWLHWCEYRQKLKDSGLACFTDALEKSEWQAGDLRDAFWKAFYKDKVVKKMSTPLLATFEGMIFDERVKRYKELAEEFQTLTQKELYARLAANVPRITDNIDNSSEIGLLKRCISNGGRGLSLRDLFDQIPTLMPRLCPCMLMSPMSVAQYLKLEGEKLDLVVFDEASQMPTSEAVGAIARGKSLIVVGDPKQMPPTSFFNSTSVDEDEAVIDDMESILEDCRTLEIPSLQLNWHYRSRHESLIAFSNNEYYDGELITFPSIDDQHAKVRLVPVKGYYDKGNKRTNRNEAEAIVREVVSRLRDEEQRKQSIGVIAFSVVQQGLIEDILQEQLDKDKELKEWADGMYEPIFVKNLENVQGDERDIILFSVGYGPNEEGKVSMNFGPLNNAGGERRLNVAVSRARQEMIIYSTMKASQIDLNRTKAKGVAGLKHFLEYAEIQALPSTAKACLSMDDSAISRQIAEELESRGYVTRTNVGRSQFRVDVAVSEKETPDVYKLGILLDGVRYRDTQTTRDREIVQPSVLSSLNWNTMRVWSVDWFNNKERVISRIIDRLSECPEVPESYKTIPFDISNEEEMAYALNSDHDYDEYVMDKDTASMMDMSELVRCIVEKEQPISFSTLCKRICNLRNLTKVTPKLQENVAKCLEGKYFAEPDRSSNVIWLTEEEKLHYTHYRRAAGREITDIPMAEIKNVIKETVSEQVAIQMDSLTLVIAKKLGFTRRGTNMDAAFSQAIAQLISDGVLETIDGKLRMRRVARY